MTPGSARAPCLLPKISHGVHGQFYTCCVEERKEEKERKKKRKKKKKRDEGCFSHFRVLLLPVVHKTLLSMLIQETRGVVFVFGMLDFCYVSVCVCVGGGGGR